MSQEWMMLRGSMALHSQALLLPYTDTSISNAQLHRLYRTKPIRPKWLSRRLVVASAAPRRKEPSKEISLNQQDLMALEFGRLLGESKEKTISKVLRRKIDPGSTYIGIEKQAKGGKGLMSNPDFGVKVEQPTRASGNASTLSPDLPRLTSPPSRQNGSSINLPKLGSKLPSYADTEEIMLDDSLLRKPSSSQGSRPVLPPSTSISPGVNNVKMLDSQFQSVLEEDSEDLERLCRPSMAKEQEAGKMFLYSSDQVNKNPKFSSQKIRSEVPSMLDNSDPKEVSKLEFQRLLDKSFNSSSVSSLPNLASPPVTRNNSSRELVQTTQQDSILKLSSPKRPRLQTLSSELDGDHQLELQGDESLKEVEEEFQHKQNVASALPHLASPPSRDKGSVGTFVQPDRGRNTATPSSMRSPTSDVFEEPLLRKPKDQASINVNLSSMQHSEGFYNLEDDEPLQSSKSSLQHNLDKPSAIPHLAAPPSRHKGSFGTFVAPGRPKIRGVESPSKEPVDEVVDDSLLRKPSHLGKERDSMDSTEANIAPLSFSTQMQLEDKIIDDSLLRRPSMEADTTQADVKISDQLDGLKQEGGSQLGGKASQLRPQADLPLVSQDVAFEEELIKGDRGELLTDDAQSSDLENSLQVPNGSNVGQDEALSTDSEQEPEPVFKIETPAQSQEELSGLDGANQVSNDVSNVSLSGGSDHSSGAKRVKVAALKKPARLTSSDSKVYASEGKRVLLDSSQDSGFSSDVTQQSLNSNANGENGNLDIGSDMKTLQSECEAEESMGGQSLVEPISVACFVPEQVSVEDQERNQATPEQLAAAIDQTDEIMLDEASYTGTTKRECTDDLLEQSKKMLRRPLQLSHADLSTQRSEQMDLQASNTKLHQAKEEEEKEWARAESLLKSKEQVEVKLIGSNAAGLFVSFGCLVGFLPSFDLSPKRGLVDFASWAQQNGILNGGLLKNIVIDASQPSTVQNVENSKPTTTAEGDLNELKNKYKEEISKLMSSFVGEKTKVIVKLLDKSRRKLKFSEKEADPGCREHSQKKANLMAELKLGDVVTCEVKSITPIGVFVEVDGVPALIHHSEVSWNTRVEPASLLNIGQVIKAKVCRLDRTLQRINLSLKQMQTDPLKRTLESVVGDSESDSSMCELEAIESMDVFWPGLEDLIKKLEKMDQISSVSRGRCLYSAAFAPTFQVLISTPQSNGYKLLGRFGNKIQEILVDTTLDRDKMKDCIRICTFSDD